MAFTLPTLPYRTNALEPFIDVRTMEIHHGKHHNAYVTNLNNAFLDKPDQNLSIEEICENISKYPVAVRNNGGGHFNHSFFWTSMAPGGGEPKGDLLDAISNSFGSFEDFKKEFNTAATTRFGSGWAWLIKDASGKLVITSTPNQDNPLMDIAEVKGKPLLGLDVWEHAYYLLYQNRRPDYCVAWWNVVNWVEVSKRFAG